MLAKSFDEALFKWRYPAILVTFLFLVYCNIYLWTAIPYADFRYIWHLGLLEVVELDGDSQAATVLQTGDFIDTVNDVPVLPGRAIFPLPEQPEYELGIVRGQQTLTTTVEFLPEPGPYAVDYRLPAGLLSAVLWLIGPLALHLARRDNQAALRVGYVFMLGGVIVMGIQGFTTGVPGAWMAGTPLTFLGAVCQTYLGFVPRSQPLSRRVRTMFKVALAVAVILGLLALFEGLVLYPQRQSFLALTGVSLYQSGFLSLTMGILACFAILLVRALRMTPSYQRQQIFVLLLFIGLGMLPATLLTFMPQFLLGVVFLPFPISIVLSILFPLGYFYVIFRKGYLGLDVLFSKIMTLTILVILTVAFYGTLFVVLQSHLGIANDSIALAAVTLAPAILLTRVANAPIDTAVQGILFGRDTLRSDEHLPAIASRLSLNPELTTLKAVVESIAVDFKVPAALLALKNTEDLLQAAVQFHGNRWRARPMSELESFFEPLVRSAVPDEALMPALLAEHEWMELVIPIILRQELIGFLALARPADGYFNLRQVRFLSRVADMIAIGSEAIFLFERSRKLSQELLRMQEAERHRLASEIHDNPLQTLSFVKSQLNQIAEAIDEPAPQEAERLLTQIGYLQATISELRNVCTGLHPAIIDKGFQLIARGLVQDVHHQHDLQVTLILDPSVPDETNEASFEAATTVFYVLREALNNVVKHAQVNEACVTMGCQKGMISLVVNDNGVGGLPQGASHSSLLKAGHMGIINMFERAESVGGRLAVEANQPQGTRISLQVPLKMS